MIKIQNDKTKDTLLILLLEEGLQKNNKESNFKLNPKNYEESCLFMLLLVVTSVGCNRIQEQNKETAPLEQEESAELQQVDWDNIQLDEGKKWRVNSRTTEGINSMSEILQQNSADSVEEYRELGNQLQKERTGVDNGRTGNDPSDDNLNIYLNPLDEKIRQLQEVQTVEEGARLKSELEQHLYAYSNYFV